MYIVKMEFEMNEPPDQKLISAFIGAPRKSCSDDFWKVIGNTSATECNFCKIADS